MKIEINQDELTDAIKTCVESVVLEHLDITIKTELKNFVRNLFYDKLKENPNAYDDLINKYAEGIGKWLSI